MKHAKKLFGALLALVAVLALVSCGGGSDAGATGGSTASQSGSKSNAEAGGQESNGEGAGKEAQATTVPTIVIRDGEPVGGIQQLEYSAGEPIRFRVKSDVAEEVHFHGYELMKDVPAGGTVSFDVPADIEGIFEVELEGLGEQIAEIRVNP
jgi:hypothetical protein